jgi:hypothetical protein
MVTASAKSFGTPAVWGIAAVLIIGPFISFFLFQSVIPEMPPTRNEWIDLLWRPIVASAVPGIAIFFLRIRLWQRILAFLVYGAIAGYLVMVILLYVACYVFHDCL